MNKIKLPTYFKGFRAHYLDNKKVYWNEIQEIKLGKLRELIRVQRNGTVKIVSPCGGVALVHTGQTYSEVEVAELFTV